MRQLQQQRLEASQTAGALPAGRWEDLLQQLTRHLDTHLAGQVDQAVHRLEASVTSNYLLSQAPADTGEADLGELTPAQRLEYLRHIQSQTDDLVRNLDLSLRAVFDALQQSVYSYQDSLNQGLNKMHTLGQQGEMMFSALVNHLAQRMNQEALSYLESSEGNRPELPVAPGPRPEELSPTAETEWVDPNGDLDLENLDLDIDFDDDEITLLQIDDEISQLQLNALGNDDDTRLEADGFGPARGTGDTIASGEPLQILEQLDVAEPDPAATVSIPAADIDAEGDGLDLEQAEDLDELYQSLFGDRALGTEPAPPAAEGPRTPPEAIPPTADDLTTLLGDVGSAFEDEMAASPSPESLYNLLDPGHGAVRPSPAPDAAAVITVASLDELLPDAAPGQGREGLDDDALAAMLDPTQAIAALPEEDLLTDEVAPTQSDLSLDQTVLETLSEDLAQLETSRPERLVPEATTDASTGFDEANEGQDLFGEARWQPAGMEPAAVADDVVGGEDSLGVSDLFSDAFAAFPPN